MFNSQRLVYTVTLGMLSVTLFLFTGCGAGVPLENLILGFMIAEDEPDTEGMSVRLVNAGTGTEELDLLVAYETEGTQNGDGIRVESITIECSAEEEVCDEFLEGCPIRIEALEERQIDDQGRLVRSRDLSGIEDFTFEEEEFDCDSFINYTFSEIVADAAVY